MDLERSVLKMIRGEKKAPLASAALALLSSTYRAAISARNFAYDREWISSVRLSAPVISIGNIAVGGTGKTPLVRLLASQLQDQVKLAILTRGFRSEIEKLGESRLISSGNGPLYPPQNAATNPISSRKNLRARFGPAPTGLPLDSWPFSKGQSASF